MIRKVQFENFRNYKKVEASLSSDLVLILGENAAGKTNFLEGLYYLSNLHSFRAPDSLLVNTQADHFLIRGSYGGHEFEAVAQTRPSTRHGYKIDGVKTKKNSWNSFRTVLFEPIDLNLFVLGPSVRRRYLNQTISQINKVYSADLASLEHVLKQKSALLKDILENRADVNELGFWNEQLAELTIRISLARQALIEFLNANLVLVYQELTGFGSRLEIEYKGVGERLNQGRLLENLESHRDAEIRSGLCLVGPHRDDFTLKKDGEVNIYYSSRGELRSQVLAIKLLQAEYLSEKEKPIVLLDDVFSELDEVRRVKLIQNLKGSQIFITSTEEHHLPKLAGNAQILKIMNNLIS